MTPNLYSQVSWELERGGDGECDVDVVVEVGDVADVAVEEEGRHHAAKERGEDLEIQV